MTPEQRAATVLAVVDDVARDYDYYDYGLPLHADEHSPRMVQNDATVTLTRRFD